MSQVHACKAAPLLPVALQPRATGTNCTNQPRHIPAARKTFPANSSMLQHAALVDTYHSHDLTVSSADLT